MTRTTRYYNLIRRLSFPSTGKVVAKIFVTAAIGCGAAFFLSTFSFGNSIFGCLVGIAVFAIPSTLSETVSAKLILSNDPLFYVRRCLALSLIVNLVWVLFLLIGGILSRIFPGFLQNTLLLGMVCAYSLRSFAIFSLSHHNFLRKLAATLLQPLACLAVAVPLLELPLAQTTLLLTVAVATSSIVLHPLLMHIEKRGEENLGVPLMNLFRAFLTVFLDMKNEPLEKHLEQLGTVQRIGTSVIVFKRRKDSTTKAVIVVSDFHPGPFLNVGSSVLPVLIQNMVEAETDGVAMVPHGVSGHEHNVVSQSENQKVVQRVSELLVKGKRVSTASKIVRSSLESASATCQAFGGIGLVTLTISPKDMEDIPVEVSSELQKDPLGFNHLVLIDSHNCIDELKPMTAEYSHDLIASGRDALQRAAYEEQQSFKVGASKLDLAEFSLDQGIGPGGLSVIVIDVGGALSAYVTVDGNNMKAGLRDETINTMRRMGISEGEVMTTDSHMVSGRVPTRLGYHPVGEAIDNKAFLQQVESAIREALTDLEDSEAEWNSGDISVKTLGRENFESLTKLIHETSRLVAYWMFLIVLIPIIFGLALVR